jgi:MFS family permease
VVLNFSLSLGRWKKKRLSFAAFCRSLFFRRPSRQTLMRVHPPRLRRSLVLLSLASLGWAFSFGLGAPLASLWLQNAGLSGRAIGLNTSAYYLGIALASPFVPVLMRRANRLCVLAGMFIDAVTTAVFPWCHGVLMWDLLRIAGGVGTALSLIPMETLVNHDALPEHRARDFGVYAFCVALGIALGSVVGLPLFPHAPKGAFALGGLVTLLAISFAWFAMPSRPIRESETGDESPFPLRAGLLSLGTAWAQGFLEGGTITFLSIYLLSLGYSEAGVGSLMGGLFAGVILAQLPLAALADRLGRLRVLLLCHAIVLTGLVCVPFVQAASLLGGWLFLLGCSCGALYPLGLALLGERIPPSGLAKANAWYLASNCAGSLSGPVLIGLTIDGFGLRAQFAAAAVAVLVVLASWVIVPASRSTVASSVKSEEHQAAA